MKYCDLVMKGGITSGIVYPNAVIALSRAYKFKSIGGTSAGAIAAAATAAAAYGDRRKSAKQQVTGDADAVGFEGLERVAAQLATEGFIYGLFQPAFGVRTAYRALVVAAGNSSLAYKISGVVLAVFAIAPIETILFFGAFLGLGFLFGGPAGLAGAAVPAFICAYICGVIASVLRVARVTRHNLMGLCSGLSQPGRSGNKRPALTDWLHGVLQQLSGKTLSEPLTFNDLWNAPLYEGEPKRDHSLSLQMITTSISHHEPRTLPFEKGAFWFREDQFALLFPADVVKWLIARAGAPTRVDGNNYYRLAKGGDLPVLVAMRMSLSFPLLISAVPLHEVVERSDVPSVPVDQDDDREKSILDSTEGLSAGGRASDGVNKFRICWFSDGGISSNFPIHLFDAPLPVWPTFAIDLVYPDGSSSPPPADVWLPNNNNRGWQLSYTSIARKAAVRELIAFLFGIVGTMQNWRDLLLARSPGQRDRIVHVALAGDEGGMNLNMPQVILDRISEKGKKAGDEFANFSFDNHYWIRWRNLASGIQRLTIGVAESVHSSPPIADYAAAYSTARTGTPPPPGYPFRSQERAEAAEKLLDELTTNGLAWKQNGPDLSVNAPRPQPQLRITPTF